MVDFPAVQFIEQDIATDPSGSRHLLDTGFVRTLGTGAGEVLDFGQVNTTGSGAISTTKLTYARVSDLGDASGVFNMRFFLTNTTAWNQGTYRFLERKTLHFVPSLELDSGNENTPVIIPSIQNLSGTIKIPELPTRFTLDVWYYR